MPQRVRKSLGWGEQELFLGMREAEGICPRSQGGLGRGQILRRKRGWGSRDLGGQCSWQRLAKAGCQGKMKVLGRSHRGWDGWEGGGDRQGRGI